MILNTTIKKNTAANPQLIETMCRRVHVQCISSYCYVFEEKPQISQRYTAVAAGGVLIVHYSESMPENNHPPEDDNF